MKSRSHSSLVVLLCLTCFLIRSTSGFAPSEITNFRRRKSSDPSGYHGHHVEFKTRSDEHHHSQSSTAVHLIRGRAALSLSKPFVANACAGLLAVKGVSLLLAPIATLKKCYKIDIEQDSLETYILRAIGAISIGASVNVYLSLIQNMTAQRSMGFSLLARFLYVLKSSLLGKDLVKFGGSKKFLSTNEVVMAWTTFSLITGAGNPIASAKVFSCLALLKGSFLAINPVAAADKFLGVDVGKDGK